MTISTINRFIRLFADAFADLGIAVPMADIERFAMGVHCDMEHGLRVYHTSAHALEMCRDMKPLQVLAALYHDLVYYQLDGGFPAHVDAMLRPVAQTGGDKFVLSHIAQGDEDLAMCAAVFNFQPGDELPVYGGLNEFLSAVAAVRQLSPWLRRAYLLAIVVCIEASIPFRGCDENGSSPTDLLAERLHKLNMAQRIGLDDAAIDGIVHDAIAFANRDVGNFASNNPGHFLSGTWMLIEESNAPLTRAGVYSVQDYRRALLRMAVFLENLNPANIYRHYRNVPDAPEMSRLFESSRTNLRFAVDYLGAKLGAMAMIEALALETGGDAPISMFLGDISAPDGHPARLANFLPPPLACNAHLDIEFLAVLEHGRSRESSTDLTSSPVTAFLYRSLGSDGMTALTRQARLMFSGALSGRSFLMGQPADLVCAIIDACRQIALSRSERLRDLGQTIRLG
jgi:hypothetical protein